MQNLAMNQSSFSDAPEGVEDGSHIAAPRGQNGGDAGTRAMVYAQDLRDRVKRRQQRRRRLYAGIVAGSVVAALVYGTVLAPARYKSEAHFSVRGTAGSVSQSDGASNLLSGGAGGSSGVGFVDGFAVNGFLKSRDAMTQLSKQVDLPKMLGVSTSAGPDALYKAYDDAVDAKFNMIEQENVIEVKASSPENSRKIAEALLSMAQAFVNRLDSQGVQNALDVDAEQLRKAEGEATAASNAVAAWRASNRNVDPEAETTLVMTMIGQIEQELNTARINLTKIRAFNNPNHPMLGTAQLQVTALEKQLAQARGRLTDGGNSQAARLKTYTQLKSKETFALNNLTAAREAYQNAYRETARLRRYVSVIARPIAETKPSGPNLLLLAFEGLLVGIVLSLCASVGMGLFGRTRN